MACSKAAEDLIDDNNIISERTSIRELMFGRLFGCSDTAKNKYNYELKLRDEARVIAQNIPKNFATYRPNQSLVKELSRSMRLNTALTIFKNKNSELTLLTSSTTASTAASSKKKEDIYRKSDRPDNLLIKRTLSHNRRGNSLVSSIYHEHLNPFRETIVRREPGGEFFYHVGKFVPGKDIYQAIRDPRIPKYALFKVFIDACKGIAVLHSKGITHGDIKPENILMTRDHRGMVIDFDFARTSWQRCKKRGTPCYYAPELVHAISAKGSANKLLARIYLQMAGSAIDIYALGCTLYYILSGGIKYQLSINDESKLLKQDDYEEFKKTRLRAIHPGIDHILEKTLAYKYSERINIHALIKELEQLDLKWIQFNMNNNKTAENKEKLKRVKKQKIAKIDTPVKVS